MTTEIRLRPFWNYFGGKWQIAPHYPMPEHATIVEPFAGAAGYSMHYHDRNVILLDKYPVITGIWSYLIKVSSEEILAIPEVFHVDELPGWVPPEARWLVGFCMNNATTTPCKQLSAGCLVNYKPTVLRGWSPKRRELVARQVQYIRHWKVVECGYADYSENPLATWFVDPPYQISGIHYKHSSKDIDYEDLGKWCQTRRGQVIVCESSTANWLPFVPFVKTRGYSNKGNTDSIEGIWLGDNP